MMKNTSPKSRPLVGCVTAFAVFMTSVAPAALAQELDSTQLETLRALAEQARQNTEAQNLARAAAAEKTREQLSQLTQSLDVATSQNEILMQMMGQIMATQAGASLDDRLEAEVAKAEEQIEVVAEATESLAESAKSELERQLAEQARKFEELLATVPNQDKLKEWQEEQIKELENSIEQNKRAMDETLDRYVEEEVLPNLSTACRENSAYQNRSIITQFRQTADTNGQAPDIGQFLRTQGCDATEELVRKLSQTRSADEAQEAVKTSMESLMTAAMMSGNPYIAAIAAVLMLLSSLFSDGNGDGDGDGVDDQPGGGPIPGAPAPTTPGGTQTVPNETTSNEATPDATPEPSDDVTQPDAETPSEESPTTPVLETVEVPVEGDPIDKRTASEILLAGGDDRIKAHDGVGCKYTLVDEEEKILNLAPEEDGVSEAFEVDLTALGNVSDFSFPGKWSDPSVRLVMCNFEAPSLLVQLESASSTVCLTIRRPSGQEGGFELGDAGFTASPGALCAGN